uniref:OSJNBb0043H09.6 protein n=1 Tax=Oryza sativa subsp. japonica TaxID=39947 RepID=Q7XT59_ORYSJ|nr:OSJNBb0043H09.6 [Oryza sativa Japonica Group]
MVDIKQTEVNPENIIPITKDQLTLEQKVEYEQMMNNLQNRFLHSFVQTRSGTVIQRYKLKVPSNDDLESSTSKDGKPKDDKPKDEKPEEEEPQEFRNLQDQIDYVVHHALINQSGVLVNTLTNMINSVVDEDNDPEVAAAEWARNMKVVMCQLVKSLGKDERYDFDITKADKIFDLLLWEKQIQLPAGHSIPSADELGKRKYCKWHNTRSHTTNDCKVLRQQIQSTIEQGKIKFDDSRRPMKVDEYEANQVDVDVMEETFTKLALSPEQAIFEKPEGTENRHLEPLYVKGFVKEFDSMARRRASIVALREGVVEGSNFYTKDTVDDLDGKLGQGFMSADDLEEVDIGPGDRSRPTFISKNLSSEFRTKLIKLLKEYRDCFAWEYFEMPGLSRSIVEHWLPIKPGYRPYQQPPRRCKADMYDAIKAEITHLYYVGFTRPSRYAEWVSNIVLVIDKNDKLRVCIDFRTLNKATPKDDYSMPVADQLVDAALGHMIISFMDVVKSKEVDDHIADLRKVFDRTRKYGLKMNSTKCAFGVSAGQFLGFLVHERGIEVTQRSINAIKKIQPPEDKKQLQSLIGKVNFIRRFMSNLSGSIGLVIISPRAASFEFAYTIKPYATNYQAEYEAVLKGLQLLKEVEADAVEIMGDSLLYLKDPSQSASRKLRYKALKYALLDDELYYRTIDGVLLKCLSADQGKVVMGEVHEGICGTHQSAHKMKWLLRRVGYFWPTMLKISSDIIKVVKIARNSEQYKEH